MQNSLNEENTALPLSRSDLMGMDELLCRHLAAFLQFGGHALYFPTDDFPSALKLLPRERKLLLPLSWQGKPLAVLALNDIRVREARQLSPLLPRIVSLALGLLASDNARRRDRTTGLLSENTLYDHIENVINRVREHLDDPVRSDSAPLYRMYMGVVVIGLRNADDIRLLHGHATADGLLARLAQACGEKFDSDILLARSGRDELALLLPMCGREQCQKMAETALEHLSQCGIEAPPVGELVRPHLCASYAVYPSDMQSQEFSFPVYEQARTLLDKARLALGLGDGMARGQVLSFAGILHQGGVVREVLPYGCVLVGLGRRVKAREGQRFAVHAPDSASGGHKGRYKGEIVLRQVNDDDSVAEIVHLDAANAELAAGDRLRLLDGADHRRASRKQALRPLQESDMAAAGAKKPEVAEDMPPFLADMPSMGLGAFMQRWAAERERHAHSTLVLVSAKPDGGRNGNDASNVMAQHWHSRFLPGNTPESAAKGKPCFCGIYGQSILVAFHGACKAEMLEPAYVELWQQLKGDGLEASIGLAGYPFLQFGRDEMQDCALKALEYASLLPEPRVGICNSLALNISADRQYSLGDIFSAVEEYKLALLADRKNVLAWISLGVCMAGLGQHQAARRHFLQALRLRPDAEQAARCHYNLGAVCQGQGENRAAAHYYRKCVELDPGNLFAHIRLGQLCEQAGRRSQARRHYEQAAGLEQNLPHASGLAQRHLAHLAVRQKRGAEARELLHDALLHNPNDAASMLLLAETYLEGREDPAVAELLARKSVALRDCPAAWRVLARALRALGRDDDAVVAEARAALV